MSKTERDRLVVVHQVYEKQISVTEGSKRARLGLRHFRRLLRRFELEGDAALAHGLRGHPSNHQHPPALRQKALGIARLPLYEDFGPTLLSEHLARDPGIGLIHPDTLRLWMIKDGLWETKPRGKRHRRRRERRPAPGELVLMDTSIHPWLEGRSSEEIVVIAMIDDATSRLRARFFRRDTGAANRQMIVDALEAEGRMGALYVDRASHFRAKRKRSVRADMDPEEGLTIIQRALAALDIELIFALSPQAKGRVERLFKTLQDRLIKEMRIAGISSLDAANDFLDEIFIPFWNQRFTVVPAEAVPAYRALPEGADLLRLFAQTEPRVIRPDFTFRYKNQHFQIERGDAEPRMPGRSLTIERRLDGSTLFRWQEQPLNPTQLAEPPKPLPRAPAEPPAPKPQAVNRPSPSHPWRQYSRPLAPVAPP